MQQISISNKTMRRLSQARRGEKNLPSSKRMGHGNPSTNWKTRHAGKNRPVTGYIVSPIDLPGRNKGTPACLMEPRAAELRAGRNDNPGVDEFETVEVLQRLVQSTFRGNPCAIVFGVFGTIHPVTTMVTP